MVTIWHNLWIFSVKTTLKWSHSRIGWSHHFLQNLSIFYTKIFGSSNIIFFFYLCDLEESIKPLLKKITRLVLPIHTALQGFTAGFSFLLFLNYVYWIPLQTPFKGFSNYNLSIKTEWGHNLHCHQCDIFVSGFGFRDTPGGGKKKKIFYGQEHFKQSF